MSGEGPTSRGPLSLVQIRRNQTLRLPHIRVPRSHAHSCGVVGALFNHHLCQDQKTSEVPASTGADWTIVSSEVTGKRYNRGRETANGKDSQHNLDCWPERFSGIPRQLIDEGLGFVLNHDAELLPRLAGG